MQNVEMWKFSTTATDTPTMEINNPKEFLKSKYTKGCIFGIDNLQKNGIYRIMGWAYNFRPYLKRYVVKQYDQWQEYYAPNKTSLRATIYGKIDIIQEITK